MPNGDRHGKIWDAGHFRIRPGERKTAQIAKLRDIRECPVGWEGDARRAEVAMLVLILVSICYHARAVAPAQKSMMWVQALSLAS